MRTQNSGGLKQMKPMYNKSVIPFAKTLRKNMTKEERHLWYDFLQSYPVRFLKQKVIDNYVVDFYCAKAKLVIELDGSGHYTEEQKIYDEKRTQELEKLGILVIRIPNNEVLRNFKGVCEYIIENVNQSIAKKQ